jgi:hypothetical protein
MSLKTLLTDLTTGVNAYPNHNTPSTSGGFNYGYSYTPIFEGVFRQKTFEFGKGRTSDRPGGAFSNEPYLYSGLLAASQLPDVPNPGGSVSVGDFVDSATDGLIRGGLLTAIKRSAQDVLRLGKWAYDGPGGPAWLLTQTGLQRSNPKTEEEQISFLGINLGGRSRVYNPLGINTLAQAFTSFSGLHINRAGLLPTSYGIKTGYNVDSTEDTKYEYQVKNNADKISDLENEVESFYLSSNRMLSLYDKVLNKGSETLYSYSGGPHSIYGIGSTTIKRYNFTRGEYSKLFYLNESKNASQYYQAGIDDQYFTPYQVKYGEGGYLYDGNEIRSNINEPGLTQTKDRAGKKLIYKNSDFDVDLAYQVNSKNITDFRQNLGRGYTNYGEKTRNGAKYIREERVNLGDPGIRLNRAVDKLGRLDYTAYSPESIDKINALDIIRTKGDFTDQRYRDLIRFRIEAVDSDKPNEADSMIFRAFLDDFSDSYNASHNSFKYNGRGEEFYTYNMFSRKISFSFKIAAQSRHEMMPLYRKLNFLVSNVAPEYKVTRMRTPFIRLTIGSMIDRVPGILNSVSLKWDKNYPWEIALDGPEKSKRDMLVLPHVLDVSVSFTPIHNFLPQKSITESPFILSHTNNRSLQEGEQWYKAGAADLDKLDQADVNGLRKRMKLEELKPFSEIIPDQSSNTQTTDDILKGNKEGEKAPAEAQSGGEGAALPGNVGSTATTYTYNGASNTPVHPSLQSDSTNETDATSIKTAQNPTQKTATQGDSETTNKTTIPPETTTTTEPEKIPIIYQYTFADQPDTNSAIVGISNNVNLPWIKLGWGNVKAQGGKEGILKGVAFKFDNFGESVEGIYFPKTGTPTAKVEGPITFVKQGV